MDYHTRALKQHGPQSWKSRYPSSFQGRLNWIPDTVVIDSMFMINVQPRRQSQTIGSYVDQLFSRFIKPYFEEGVREVHLVFDNPNQSLFNPKEPEQKKRDSDANLSAHQHIEYTPATQVPVSWKQHIKCRQCKRSKLLKPWVYTTCKLQHKLSIGQTLVLGGCFDSTIAWVITNSTIPQPEPRFNCNALEGDMRVWKHALKSEGTNILLYSPDTDVYNIGLGLAENSKHVMVQLNPPHLEESYVDMRRLLQDLQNDSSLITIPSDSIGLTLQTLFVVSGCDYVSYLHGFGKKTVLRELYYGTG